MNEIADRYRSRADAFECKVAAVRPDQWSNQSPCEDWTARDVVGHIIDMHGVMLAAPLRPPAQPSTVGRGRPAGRFQIRRWNPAAARTS